MAITFILCSVAAVLCAMFYCIRRQQMRVFKDMGIPGPEPNFLFGNLLSLKTKSFHEIYQEWTKTYGSTYGYFEGPTPVLVTSSTDILHQVFIKQFSKFHARKVFPVQVDPDKDEDVHMFFARGERWKRLRSIVNPAFSSAKMRMMSPVINKCVDNLVDNVGGECDRNAAFNIHEQFQRLTLDTILHCAFNLKSRALQDPNDPFLKHCHGVITDTTKRPLLFLLGFLFPALHALWIFIYYFLRNIQFNPFFWLEEKINAVIEERKSTNFDGKDMLQLMMKARFKGRCFPYEKETEKGFEMSQNNANQNIAKTLSNKEIVSQALLFTLAGYETTSTSLAYIFYELARNPHIQENIWEEIQQHYPNKNDVPNYDNVRGLTYLEQVIKETLRKYVVASNVIARQCRETAVVEGITIPKGMLVQADVWSLHRREDLWGPDAEEFQPQRFAPEKQRARHPMAWMPFGGGPRMCAGLRFAILQAKTATVELIRNFQFALSKDMTTPLQLIEGATVCPKDGIHLTAKRRS
ncbi:cytochrome P450 3A24-like [Haliotis rufescens]|uniref:cytochrome P450 3A24-like n=1 Tax=Haliotis rufescens TaxID=6454 RepID=UPI001EAFF1E4|nr:cytochrome P450 3A24-like [Haliotis rufescens]